MPFDFACSCYFFHFDGAISSIPYHWWIIFFSVFFSLSFCFICTFASVCVCVRAGSFSIQFFNGIQKEIFSQMGVYLCIHIKLPGAAMQHAIVDDFFLIHRLNDQLLPLYLSLFLLLFSVMVFIQWVTLNIWIYFVLPRKKEIQQTFHCIQA